MGHILGQLFLLLIFIGIFAAAIYQSVFMVSRSYKKCTCGEHDKCTEYLEITAQGRVTKHGMIQCGKFQKYLKELEEHPVMKKITKDIKEKGSSGPFRTLD